MVLVFLPLMFVGAACATDPAGFAGRAQSEQVQVALQRCLSVSQIDYQPIVVEPGSVRLVVPAPVPAEWWAAHGGYGLISDQGGEVALDPRTKDPNADLLGGADAQRALEVLYGAGGSPEAFSSQGCYDRALRAASFYEESRSGSLGLHQVPDPGAVGREPEVIEAQRKVARCLTEEGYPAALASAPEATLRARFVRQGLIWRDGEVRPSAPVEALAHASEVEEAVAIADLRCRRSARLDELADRAVRRLVEGGS